MENLGDKIREERRKRKLTLIQLSEKTKLSVSFLSQVERGITNPSISSLKKIAREFGTSVVSLFMNGTDTLGNFGLPSTLTIKNGNAQRFVNDVKIVRADRRKRVSLPGSNVFYDLLTSDLNRQLEVMYLKVGPGEHSGDDLIVDPPGEKFGIVLKGMLEVRVKDKFYQLRTGDSIYHPVHFPHSWRVIGEETTEVIWVLTPPWF